MADETKEQEVEVGNSAGQPDGEVTSGNVGDANVKEVRNQPPEERPEETPEAPEGEAVDDPTAPKTSGDLAPGYTPGGS